MRYILFFIFLPFLIFAQNIPEKPSPPRLVNDLVGLMSAEEQAALERKLVGYEDSTSTQIAIVTVKSTGGYEANDVAFQILRQWGVGQKGKNNGMVMLIATEDRKIAIQTGAGISGSVPDILIKRIIDQQIIPAFKQQKYYDGFDRATSSIIERAKGEFKNDKEQAQGIDPFLVLIILLVVGFFLFIMIKSAKDRRGMVVTRRGYTNWDGGGWWYVGGDPWHNRGGGSGWDNGGGGGGFDFGGFGGGDGDGGGATGEW
jgi:uncharacterized protein